MEKAIGSVVEDTNTLAPSRKMILIMDATIGRMAAIMKVHSKTTKDMVKMESKSIQTAIVTRVLGKRASIMAMVALSLLKVLV